MDEPCGKSFPLWICFLTCKVKGLLGNSQAVQWLGVRASTAGGTGSIPGQRTKIPRATKRGQKKKRKKKVRRLLSGVWVLSLMIRVLSQPLTRAVCMVGKLGLQQAERETSVLAMRAAQGTSWVGGGVSKAHLALTQFFLSSL